MMRGSIGLKSSAPYKFSIHIYPGSHPTVQFEQMIEDIYRYYETNKSIDKLLSKLKKYDTTEYYHTTTMTNNFLFINRLNREEDRI